MEKIIIKTEYIKLSQLLKLATIVGQGSDAKSLILDGQVKVNDAVATQRGKKVYNNDIVLVSGHEPFTVFSVLE